MTKSEFLEQFQQITPDVAACEKFLNLVPDTHLSHLDHLGLILVAPETFAFGLAGELADKIAQSHFLPLDIAFIDALTEDQISAMFIPGWIPERFRFWLIQRRFMMGPTAAILITHLNCEPIGPLLQQTKGYRIPYQAAAGTWRGDLPSINGVLNLVHTADNPLYVLRNGAPFFSTEQLVAALQKVPFVRAGHEPSLSWEKIKQYAFAGYTRSAHTCIFLQVYCHVLQRMIARQWLANPHPCFVLAQHEINNLLQTKGTNKELLGSSIPFRAIQAVAQCAAHCEPAAADLLRFMTSLHTAHQVTWDQLLYQFKEIKVTLDRWESLILMSTLYYADQELSEELLSCCRQL